MVVQRGQCINTNLMDVLYGFEHGVNYRVLIVNILELRKTASQKLYGPNKNTLDRLEKERIIKPIPLK